MPQGIDTPGEAQLPRGDKTSGVPTEGEGVPGEEERGRGGDINSPPPEQQKRARSQRQ